MLSIPHAATGTFIATTIPNPILSTPLIVAIHFLQDWIPHWDVGSGLSSGKRKKTTAFFLEIFDLLITGVIIFLVFQLGKSELVWQAWYGAFIALLPDFLDAPKTFFKMEIFFLKPMSRLHAIAHQSTQNKIIGLTPQIINLIVIWFLV